MVEVKTQWKPNLAKHIKWLIETQDKIVDGLGDTIRNAALELNKEVKRANPQDTGLSRRAWGAPRRLNQLSWQVINRVGYTPKIRYGKKKKSKFAGAPKGIRISPGKKFLDVVNETFDAIDRRLERKILQMIDGVFK